MDKTFKMLAATGAKMSPPLEVVEVEGGMNRSPSISTAFSIPSAFAAGSRSPLSGPAYRHRLLLIAILCLESPTPGSITARCIDPFGK